MMSKVGSQSNVLLSVIAGFAGQCSHSKLKLSRWNGISRVWDASKNPFVTLRQIKVIQGHEVEKVKFKMLCLSGVIHVFGQDFRQNAKNDPRTLLNGLNPMIIENRKMPKSS